MTTPTTTSPNEGASETGLDGAGGGDGSSTQQTETSTTQQTGTSTTQQTGTTTTTTPKKSDWTDNLTGVLGVLLVFGLPVAIFANNRINQQGWSSETKLGVKIGAIALVILIPVVGFAVYFRKRQNVWRAIAFVSLLVTIAVFSVIPSYLLGANERYLFLKLLAIFLLAGFPGLLYVQFIQSRGATLREEFVENLHRLRVDRTERLPPSDTPTWEMDKVQSLYLRKFDGQYGGIATDDADSREFQLRGEGILSVILTTVLLAIGWALVLQPEVVVELRILPTTFARVAGLTLPAGPLAFGFLGSYFFVVQMLVRRYFQDDLRTSAYVHASARVIVVALLVTALHVVWPGELSASTESGLAFLIGVFPQIGLKAIQEFVARSLRWLVHSLDKPFPLDQLDGLDVWYETRLLEEGIEDMQNLATVSIVDVMLRTRVPVGRLVDWIDQALLYLRVRDDDEDDQADGKPWRPLPGSSREILRRFGIRTATDLEDALGSSTDAGRSPPKTETPEKAGRPTPPPETAEGEGSSTQAPETAEDVTWILNPHDDKGNPIGPSVTRTILSTLKREPNLAHVRAWKEWSPTS